MYITTPFPFAAWKLEKGRGEDARHLTTPSSRAPFAHLTDAMPRIPESGALYYRDDPNSILGSQPSNVTLISAQGHTIPRPTNVPDLVRVDRPFSEYPDNAHFFARLGDDIGIHLRKRKATTRPIPNFGRLSKEGQDIVDGHVRWKGFGIPLGLDNLLHDLAPHFGRDHVHSPDSVASVLAFMIRPGSTERGTNPDLHKHMMKMFRRAGISAVEWAPMLDRVAYHRIRAFQPVVDRFHAKTGGATPVDDYPSFRLPLDLIR
jgi:hypothetical protein